MKSETARYMIIAERALVQARGNLDINFPDQAARLAYYAEFHAAQALIVERSGKIPKTHRGVQQLFHKLVRAEPQLDPTLPRILTNSYRDKEIADYDADMLDSITAQDAADAIAAASIFVRAIQQAIELPPAPASTTE